MRTKIHAPYWAQPILAVALCFGFLACGSSFDDEPQPEPVVVSDTTFCEPVVLLGCSEQEVMRQQRQGVLMESQAYKHDPSTLLPVDLRMLHFVNARRFASITYWFERDSLFCVEATVANQSADKAELMDYLGSHYEPVDGANMESALFIGRRERGDGHPATIAAVGYHYSFGMYLHLRYLPETAYDKSKGLFRE